MRRGPWLVAGLLAALALGPALRPGYTLSYDMVFVPRLDLTRDLVGLGDGLPRAVPVDAVVAVVTRVVPAAVLQPVLLLATLVLAGAGAARLTRRLVGDAGAAGAVAAAAYVWNPYVAERLVLGHWALLVAYAALPWLADAAAAARRGDRRALAVVVLQLGVCGLTPTGGLLGGLVAGAVLAGRWRVWAVVLGAWAVVNATWWLPGLLHDGRDVAAGAAAAGVSAFAVRGEGWLGPVGTVAGLGGVWNADVVPGSRETVLGVLATLVLLALGAVGVPALRRSPQPALARSLGAAAATGLVLALLGAVPGARSLLADLVAAVPAAGLLRDGHKWLAPWALLLAVAVGAGVGRLADRVRDPAQRALAAVAGVVVLVALLPDLVWGASGRLEAVSYPDEWERARDRVAAEGGDVLVLPWGAFRVFGWNGDRTVLDPATRYLPGSALAADDLVVGDEVVPGESGRVAAGRAALGRPDAGPALRRLGVRWVLVHRDQPGAVGPVPAGRTVVDGPTLTLRRLAGPVAGRPLPGHAWAVVVADLVALGLLGAAAVRAGRDRGRRVLLVGTVRRGRGLPAGRAGRTGSGQ